MQIITKKRMLYKSKMEDTDYAMNHILGCSHNCQYPCAACQQAIRFGRIHSKEDWCKPKIVGNTLVLLTEEIPRLKGKIQSVFLCPSTDPFMYKNKIIKQISLAAIEKLNQNLIRCKVLTKGILPEILADSKFSPLNEYGISLVSLDEDFRKKFEPGAAPIIERLQALKNLHNNHLNTWAAIEPYPTPNIIQQDIIELLKAVSFVDKIIFGRTNYSTKVTSYNKHKQFYIECAAQVKNFCKQHDIECLVKAGTIKKGGQHD